MDTEAILRTVDHRPYPLPAGPWIMTQAWHELLFAHWPLASDVLRPLVPSILPLDTFEGQAWVGIVPFYVTHASPRYVPPVPGLSQFPELNVRTYVMVDGIPGVYFFSLDAGNPLAVILARLFFHLPYYYAVMRCSSGISGVYYYSDRKHPGAASAKFEGLYRPTGSVSHAQRGTLEYWLIERYCLYTVVKHHHVYRAEIHHRPWPLQPAELKTMRNTMALAQDIPLPDALPLLHYSQLQEVLVWPLRRVL